MYTKNEVDLEFVENLEQSTYRCNHCGCMRTSDRPSKSCTEGCGESYEDDFLDSYTAELHFE